MQKLILLLVIIGEIILVSFLIFGSHSRLQQPDEISKLEENEIKKVQGEVVKETLVKNKRVIYLKEGISFSCYRCRSYIHKNISSIVQIDYYENKPSFKALEISEKD